MAHKKGAGSSRNVGDSEGKRLGIKLYGGEIVAGGEIIVRQRGTTLQAGQRRRHRQGRHDLRQAPPARWTSRGRPPGSRDLGVAARGRCRVGVASALSFALPERRRSQRGVRRLFFFFFLKISPAECGGDLLRVLSQQAGEVGGLGVEDARDRAGDADRGDRAAAAVEDRGRHAGHAELVFLVVGRVATAADLGQIVLQLVERRQRARRRGGRGALRRAASRRRPGRARPAAPCPRPRCGRGSSGRPRCAAARCVSPRPIRCRRRRAPRVRPGWSSRRSPPGSPPGAGAPRRAAGRAGPARRWSARAACSRAGSAPCSGSATRSRAPPASRAGGGPCSAPGRSSRRSPTRRGPPRPRAPRAGRARARATGREAAAYPAVLEHAFRYVDRSNTMSSAPFHSTCSPSGRSWSTPSTIVRKWLPASWPTIDANIVPP